MYAQHKYPNANIELTGHSLGGSLAQIESAKQESLPQHSMPMEQVKYLKIKVIQMNK